MNDHRPAVGAGRRDLRRAVISSPVAPAQAMTTSASASTAARSLSGAARPAYSAASRSARSRVRLTTTTSAAPRRDDGRGGQPGHRAGADHERPACRRRRRPWRRGPVEGGADQGRRGAVDVGLGAGALADPQRLLEQHVERRADGAELLAEPQRVAGLAEDLALADGHRVEPGGDLEQVGDGAVVVVDVEVRQHRLGGLAGPLDEQPGDLLDAAVEAVDVGVDLEPVAGGDDGRLGDVLAGGDVVRSAWRRRRPSSATRSSSDDRGGVVGDAHDQDAHAATARSTCAHWRACAARGRRGSAARWRGRPCARRRRRAPRAPSGAKLRMLVMPAGDHPVGDVLGGRRRGGDHADRDAVLRDDRSRSSKARTSTPGDAARRGAPGRRRAARRRGSRGCGSRSSWPARGRGCRCRR